ncbi:MAG: hypothetical protein NT003_02990 [Candidatus Magasanikbacteria bacterium]|nr:hypothetical protein [Candidatus Magasanikbacteria bacterium]
MKDTIRTLLAQLVSSDEGKNWYIPDRFESVTRDQLPSQIKILKSPPSPEKNYNCFIYVLGLTEEQNIIAETHGFLYQSFFKKIISKSKIQQLDKAQPGAIIAYHNGSEITHIGIIQPDNSVISKWSWGPLIQHEIFDVPDYYGDVVTYYKNISTRDAIKIYKKYKNFNLKK